MDVLNQMTAAQMFARVKRMAQLVSAGYIAALLIVATVVPGAALGGGVIVFIVALAFIGALSILVLYVMVSGATQNTSSLVEDKDYSGARSSRFAA